LKIRVKITAFAKNQLDKIDEYYKQAGYYRRGKRLRKELVKQSALLSKNPKLGQEVEDVIYITDLFDTRQNPTKINPEK